MPREALYVGLAGVIPYLATSLSTVYLSFDIQYAASTGQGFILSGETAEALLHIIEPIQLGYGASVSGHIRKAQLLADYVLRLSLSLVLFTGVSNGLDSVDTKAILDTQLELLRQLWPGLQYFCPPRSV